MSGCLSLCPYKMSTNIVHETHPSNPNTHPNPKFSAEKISSLGSKGCSFRRSLSANMSNQNWLQNNGFPVKRVRSSEQLQALGEENFEKKSNDDDQVNDGHKGGAAFEDIWSSILSQKKLDGSGELPPPYVHPLVKRSTSSLSEKSLEVCTESLGSETGSDGLFSHPASDKGQEVEEEEVEGGEEMEHGDVEEMRGFVEVAKYKCPVNKRVGPPKSFPPPLPSLANREDGLNLQMRSRRQEGRLVLEAVSVPSQNCFRAQRQDGRLLLTLTNDGEEEDGDDDDDDDGDEMMDEAEEEERVEDGGGNVGKLAIVMEETGRSRRFINVHTSSSGVIMSKLMELTSAKNQSTWPRYYNTPPVIKSLEEEDIEEETPGARVSTGTGTGATSSLNAYEYYWRRSGSPTAAAVAVLKPMAGKHNAATISPQVVKQSSRNNTFLLTHNGKLGGAEQVVVVKAAAVEGATGEKPEYLVRGCKQPWTSLLLLDPFCIATS